MAKTVEQYTEIIKQQREKIKTAEQTIARAEEAIKQIEDRELVELARKIKAAGKLDAAKKLIENNEPAFAKPNNYSNSTAVKNHETESEMAADEI